MMSNQCTGYAMERMRKVCLKLNECIQLGNEEFQKIRQAAFLENPWFEIAEVDRMLHHIQLDYLDDIKMRNWLARYNQAKNSPAISIGIVAAGNIPLASFHDVLCAVACGCAVKIKLSSRDSVLTTYLYSLINKCLDQDCDTICFVENLDNVDAVLISGSNLTARHFRKKLNNDVPCLVRSHRNGIAILSGMESEKEIISLGYDIFSYYGLGCRNVTKLYIPDEAMLIKIAAILDEQFGYIKNNIKYSHNYTYQFAGLSLSNCSFYHGQAALYQKSGNIHSPIAVIHFEVYNDLNQLQRDLNGKLHEIQCIVTNEEGMELPTVKLGKSQYPELWDYQDGLDVITFISQVAHERFETKT